MQWEGTGKPNAEDNHTNPITGWNIISLISFDAPFNPVTAAMRICLPTRQSEDLRIGW
jgi:hypothetical protein